MTPDEIPLHIAVPLIIAAWATLAALIILERRS